PADPEQYRHNGGWRRFERHDDSIAIAGAPPRQITLRASVHGPVTLHDPARNRAVAIASVHLGKGASTMPAMVAINLAQGWDSLIRAFAHHPPPTNLHYADTSGNTGWHAIGYAPERKTHNGLLPVPGDGAFDWQGIRAVKDMPSILNPRAGWFASANQDNVPEGYTGPMAHSFSAPFRYHRIEAVLPAKPRQTIADSVALQHDIHSEPALRLLALLPAQAAGDAGLALSMLRNWDGAIAGDKGAPALYEMLVSALQHHLLEALVPEALRKLVPLVDSEALLTLLEQPDPRLGPNPAAVRATMLEQALGEAWQAARKALGDDPTSWRWDRLHKVVITHPLAAIPEIAKAFPPIDTAGTGGDTSTVMARWYRPGGSFHVAGGASYLMVVDVGGWDNSLFLNLPGQCADPRSPHRQDLYAPWIAGQMQPLLFSTEAVNRHAAARTVLSATGA
ncbi:penicillin acylase family protein, partial [Novosphingobium rosa]|uniref:penicillin acylase family protein n=1 Tax=Novosphingobium rosa TaxID=76978 RepID=UPI000A6D3CA8